MTTLIVDAGSTKTTFRVVDSSGASIKNHVACGLNPAVMDWDFVMATIKAELDDLLGGDAVDRIYYYGAGVNTTGIRDFLVSLLAGYCCGTVEVGSDMLGAARAVLGDEGGIVGILGTGSNSCAYDGRHITANVPPLGYILGDEGSGAVITKRFMGELYKGLLPDAVVEKWERLTGVRMADVISSVYRGDAPSRFLASFMPVIVELSDNNEVARIIDDELALFFSRNVMRYDTDSRRIGFVGSVALHLESRLRRVAAAFGYEVTCILADPMDSLAAYHSL